MFCKVFRACEKNRSALRILKRFRSHERSTDRSHDNVANNLGEDCDLTGKVNSFFSNYMCLSLSSTSINSALIYFMDTCKSLDLIVTR